MRTLFILELVALLGSVISSPVPGPQPEPDPVRYDQSQSGHYNIQIDLKNVEIFAILDELGLASLQNDDYDYGELTLKPPTVWNASTSTGVDESTSKSPDEAEVGTASSVEAAAVVGANQEAATTAATAEPAAGETAKPPNRRCGAGYYRDRAGRCRRVRKPHNSSLFEFFHRVHEKYKGATK